VVIVTDDWAGLRTTAKDPGSNLGKHRKLFRSGAQPRRGGPSRPVGIGGIFRRTEPILGSQVFDLTGTRTAGSVPAGGGCPYFVVNVKESWIQRGGTNVKLGYRRGGPLTGRILRSSRKVSVWDIDSVLARYAVLPTCTVEWYGVVRDPISADCPMYSGDIRAALSGPGAQRHGPGPADKLGGAEVLLTVLGVGCSTNRKTVGVLKSI